MYVDLKSLCAKTTSGGAKKYLAGGVQVCRACKFQRQCNGHSRLHYDKSAAAALNSLWLYGVYKVPPHGKVVGNSILERPNFMARAKIDVTVESVCIVKSSLK